MGRCAARGKRLVKSTSCDWRRVRTEAVSEHRPRIVQVVIQLIVNEAKGEDQEVEEDPDKEEQATATLVNHPNTPLVEEFLGLVWALGGGAGRIRALKGLQTPPLGLVSLEVGRRDCAIDVCLLEVRVLVEIGGLAAVGKVETGGPPDLAEIGGHWADWGTVGELNGLRRGRPALTWESEGSLAR